MSERPFELPPLELLVAFESAARQLSFTRAGDEIALTQSAVSRQILALEERLGVMLFRRLHRALALTEDGVKLYAATVEALGRLDRVTRELRHSERAKTVVVTTTPGFAGLWLIPRLAGFIAAHPGVDVRISASNELVNLDRDGVDVAVRYRPVKQRRRRRPPVRRDRLAGLQPAPAAAAASAARAARRPRQAHAAAHGARRRQPAAGLGPVAACARPERAAPGGRAALLFRTTS